MGPFFPVRTISVLIREKKIITAPLKKWLENLFFIRVYEKTGVVRSGSVCYQAEELIFDAADGNSITIYRQATYDSVRTICKTSKCRRIWILWIHNIS